MKKLLFGFSLLVLLFGCSSSNSEEIEKEPTIDYPCRYEYILKSVDNPIVSTTNNPVLTISGFSSYKTISFDINYSDYNTNDLGEPNVEKTCRYFKGIAYSEFRKYQSHFTEFADRKFIGKMQNNDYFYFDKNETKETQKIKVTFYCVH